MRLQLAPLFLILVAAVALNFSLTRTAIVIVGYSLLSNFDRWLREKELRKLWDYEVTGWKRKTEQSEWEDKGSLSRIRLTGENQILYGRIVEFLSRVG